MGYYCSLEFANEYLNHHPKISSKWTILTDDSKNGLIDYMEQEFDNIPFMGFKLDSYQVHSFPRDFFNEITATIKWNFIDNIVKVKVASANKRIPEECPKIICEMIVYWLSTANFQKLLDLQSIGTTDMKAGSVEFTFERTNPARPLPNKAWILGGYLTKYYWQKDNINLLERL